MLIVVPPSLKPEIVKPPDNYKSKCGNHNGNGVEINIDGKEDNKTITQFGEWPNMCQVSQRVSRIIHNVYLHIICIWCIYTVLLECFYTSQFL